MRVEVNGITYPEPFIGPAELHARCNDNVVIAADTLRPAVWNGPCSGPAAGRPCILNPLGNHQNIGANTSPATLVGLTCGGP